VRRQADHPGGGLGDVVGGQWDGAGINGAGPCRVAPEPVDAEFCAADEARFKVSDADAGSGEVGAQVEAELGDESLRGAIDVAARIGVGGGGAAEIDDVAPVEAGSKAWVICIMPETFTATMRSQSAALDLWAGSRPPLRGRRY
jgi:hypothetical protein